MSRKAELREAPATLDPQQAEAIRSELERVTLSHQFRSSRRCQNLLRHITEHTLIGDSSALKERVLGVEVFGREPDYDTNQDPVVRATAAEIRKKLAQYYQEADHQAEPHIDLQPGSYVVEFHFNGHPPVKPQRGRRATLIGSVAAACVILALAPLFLGRFHSDLDSLWAPVLSAPGEVLICLGQPVVYNLKSAKAQDAIQGGPPQAAQASAGLPVQDAIPRKELVIFSDRYVALGDAVCLVRLTSLFEKHGKPYRIRGEQATSFADLREGPAILIAAFDNQWTLRATGQLRFTFVKDSEHDTDMVRDRQHPNNTEWRLTGAWPYWEMQNDYAIVSRVLDAATDRPVVIAAGITQYGTMAAGEFLSNPREFAEAVPQLPRDWKKKNLQIVLRVPVVRRAPGRPRILAVHVW